ncbi:RNA cytosine C(5)-methyltransferase NSUN2 [Fulvia fulva]|uniref:RNA cytosine C(5)-methyltransferase NSUN2 n=1 Tax=Passalora fulva TaxID=5499 RepID=A0A9Q8UU48_PASFU|nr:RNA cytosine C(5)-methyltransferase NSUN2 [Fulvia fulva]KAK4626265.1 RNA cytosine C(5)-methyltransferase NSUN2 [Fulvia fulva]KAK4628315.1 RNA cytosine C(5)-methyltransferase NSUN2 [Fulvia fulva]UJO22584.1 RNA cytosine C(5)-methyltransferase NSUN2 [Fulvia fulva]WPV13188.1 RNA cytosine C(5)-methyltransferase NSUN2 [Fulvia fulva]WPV28691.1 RNA cytosine C(5)-methyltransferase NSUN2 [Fulvia fulva]
MGRGGRGRGRGGGGGGRGRGRGRGGGGGGGNGGCRNFVDDRQSFDQVNKTNEKFERFYNTLNLVPAGEERDAFWTKLRSELPNSFRFTGSKGHARGVRDNLVNRFFPLIKEIKHDGRPVELPKQIAWYPEGLGYRMATPKNVIRKYEPFKEFQKFLVSETGVGNISRQEEVSMIPPLLLDVQPHHTVLDLCAAPGSKSAQLVELIHAGEEDRVDRAIRQAKGEKQDGVQLSDSNMTDGGRATGMLVANDVNYQRAQMLVHQVKRLNSPNLVVTNHDATMFPSIELPPETLAGGQKRGRYLKFDRVLADVPCSGDGTCRKNPSIWKEWTPQNALGLYQTQVRILTRALQMTQVGGRVVYSTCSMNPVEDEAVVASAIERCGGSTKVKIVDCSDRLPGLVRNQGLKDWSIMNRNGQIYESWAEAEGFEDEQSRIVPGMFAPGPEENIPLEHCMRVYPHQQDTGGFFIVALEKLSEIKAKPENQSKSANRKWVFTEPEVPTETAFTELLDEVSNSEPKEPVTVPELHNGETSAAQRQNEPDDASSATSLKRSAPAEDDTAATKKPKLEGVDTGRAEHVSVPPAVALAVEVSGAEPGNQTVTNSAPAQPKRRKDDPTSDEAFKFIIPEHPELVSIYNFYELHPLFPRDRFLVRNPAGDPVKGIYYSSQLVKDILITNDKRGMKFVHAGVKMFMKQDAQGQDICRWRIQTEGLPIIEGWVGERRVIRLQKKATLRKLLVEMFPKVATTKHEDGTESGGWKDLGEIGEQVRDMSMGCCVLRVEASEDGSEDGFKEPLTLPLWKSMASVNLMLPKEDRRAMLLRIYNEDVELINHSDPKQQARNAQKQNGGSIPAENDAKELQQKFKDESNADVATTAVDDASGLPISDEGAMALEQDALAKEDKLESKRMEGIENEDQKIHDAMPERAGEGDSANTTV